jgi:hypothetical protein
MLRLSGEPSEDELHESIAKALRFLVREPAVFIPYPAGWVRLSQVQQAKYSRMGIPRGVPDFLGWYDRRSYGIELKRAKTGRLSKGRWDRTARGSLIWRQGQEEMFARLNNAGMMIAICHNLPEVEKALTAWGIPMRGHSSLS